jgi:hypothetical protein
VWDGDKFRPIAEIEEIKEGKFKDKYWVTFGDGKRIRVNKGDIKLFEDQPQLGLKKAEEPKGET